MTKNKALTILSDALHADNAADASAAMEAAIRQKNEDGFCLGVMALLVVPSVLLGQHIFPWTKELLLNHGRSIKPEDLADVITRQPVLFKEVVHALLKKYGLADCHGWLTVAKSKVGHEAQEFLLEHLMSLPVHELAHILHVLPPKNRILATVYTELSVAELGSLITHFLALDGLPTSKSDAPIKCRKVPPLSRLLVGLNRMPTWSPSDLFLQFADYLDVPCVLATLWPLLKKHSVNKSVKEAAFRWLKQLAVHRGFEIKIQTFDCLGDILLTSKGEQTKAIYANVKSLMTAPHCFYAARNADTLVLGTVTKKE